MNAARITAIACVVLTAPLIKGCGTGEAGEPVSPAPEPPLPVRVADAWRGEARALHQTTTHLEAVEEATLVTRVAGEVVDILVEEGETVAAGQVLARLDGERLRLRLAEVRARLDQVRREYRRNVQLHERGLVSQTAYESVRYDMEALESEYRLASLEVSYTEIKAPFPAVVTERLIKIGNTLPAGTGAFRIGFPSGGWAGSRPGSLLCWPSTHCPAKPWQARSSGSARPSIPERARSGSRWPFRTTASPCARACMPAPGLPGTCIQTPS